MKKSGIANTNEFGLVKGKEYAIEIEPFGSAHVYNLDGSYLTYCRTDSFDSIKEIKLLYN